MSSSTSTSTKSCPTTHRSARLALRRVSVDVVRRRNAPPPKLTVSQWADRYRHLSRESSPEPGRWRTDRVPYMREVMDAFSDPGIEQVVVMSASQVAKTEVLNNVVAFYIDQDPAPILVVQPNVKPMAETWSKDRLAPMLRDTPKLAGVVRDPRSRDSGNTVLHKVYAGGHITVIGANSPAGLASRPIRIVLFDEVDRFPASAGTEGDQIKLGVQRTRAFWNRKIGLFSSPGWKGISRIEKAHALSDQRSYEVPCWLCGAYQVLRWGTPRSKYGIKFARTKDGVLIPESVHYQCAHCHEAIDEMYKMRMLRAGRWVAKYPGRRVAGFHLSALCSPFPNARWANLAEEFLEAQGEPEQLKTFVNLQLGEPWEDRANKVDATVLAARAGDWPADVPAGVGLLTAGVDVQDDRLELLIDGWGAEEESWRVAHHRLHGDPEEQDVWNRLDALLVKPWIHVSGQQLRVHATMIDSGHLATRVYEFVRPRQARNVWASKGVAERGRSPLTRAQKANRQGIKLWTIGTVQLKDTLFSRLRIQRPGPRYMHMRKAQPDGGFDAEFYAQYDSERPEPQLVRGRRIRRYVQIRDRNEAIDLEVLNLAALEALGAGAKVQLATWAAKYLEAPAPPDHEPAPARRRGRRGGGYVTGWAN